MYADGPRELQSDGIEAESFEALAKLAVAHLTHENVNVGMVCGPISTGGTGNQKYNFQVFNAVIHGLKESGHSLFDQTPYEFGLRKLAYAWEAKGNTGYCVPILTTFYARVFETGLVTDGWFIPGWKSSFGARWERKKFKTLNVNVHDLTHNELESFLCLQHAPNHVNTVLGLMPKN